MQAKFLAAQHSSHHLCTQPTKVPFTILGRPLAENSSGYRSGASGITNLACLLVTAALPDPAATQSATTGLNSSIHA